MQTMCAQFKLQTLHVCDFQQSLENAESSQMREPPHPKVITQTASLCVSPLKSIGHPACAGVPIAATAIDSGFTVVWRNMTDFDHTGVALINLWLG